MLTRFLTIVSLFWLNAYCEDTLRLVNLVYRHGDRSPIDIYPTNPNQIDKWPQGLGWLSKTGMQEQYELGQWLKSRYIDTSFMSADYNRTQIRVESSDEERCLMSAYSNLAGMFPPSGDQIFSPNISWQPIPVHTRPYYMDNMLNMGEKCPQYDKLLAATLQTHAVQEEEKENKEFYKWLGNQTGWSHENISNVWRIADTLFCEKAHNLTLPDWVEKMWDNDTITTYDKVRKLEAYQFRLLFNGSEASKLKGGPLLSRFQENMKQNMRNESATKMYMYSAHDTTLAAMMINLGIYDGETPQYASTFIMELHKTNTSKYYVNLYYKNVTNNDTAQPLTLKGCEFNCPLDVFSSLTKDLVPTDWKKECGIPSGGGGGGGASGSGMNTGWIVSIVLGCLLLGLILLFIICMLRARKAEQFLYGRFDATTSLLPL